MSENINVSLIVIVCLVVIVIMMLVRLLKQRQEYSQAVSKSRIIKKDKEVLLDNIDEFVHEKENETQLEKLKAEMQFEELDSEPQKGYHGPLNVYRAIMPDTEDADKESFVDFTGFRLLIVEDNLINQKILLGVLRDSGMKIDVANNGQEALDFLLQEKREYDIVLMDISMPVMDGEECTKNIRKHEEFINMPVVAFTAFAMGPEIEEMFNVGVNGYMTKPLNVKKLYTVFARFLTKTA